MAGPGGKSVGRVSIRVVPDTSRFREDLNKALTRIEKVAKVDVRVNANTDDARDEIVDFRKWAEEQSPTLKTDLDTASARASLALLTRPRTVAVSAVMNPASLAEVGAALAGLSGIRVMSDYMQRVQDSLLNLDRSVPKIAGVTLALSSLASAAISAGGGLVTVGAGLAQAAAAGLALPGIIGGAAVATGTLIVALQGAGDYIGDLGDQWRELAPVIQDNFWGVAEASIRSLSDSVLPTLRSELGTTASELGAWAASVADGFREAFTPEVFANMFGPLNESIQIASTATGAFADILAGLGQVGAAYLPALAQWTADITTRFSEFIQQAMDSGEIFTWIDNGILALQQLGSIIGSLGGILNSLYTAATAAGGGGLATLADVMQRMNEVMQGPAFQGAMTAIFRGAATGMEAMAAALEPIGDMFEALAPTIEYTLGTLGGVVGSLLGEIANALADPAVAGGITALVNGLRDGFAALEPALGPLAQALGAMMSFIGPLAATIGGVLGAAVQAVAPVLTTLFTALEPLIPILGQALVQAIQLIAPLLAAMGVHFATIATAVMPLIEQLLPVFMEIFNQIAPALTETVTALAPLIAGLVSAFIPAIMQIVQSIMPLVQEILPVLAQLLQALSPIVGVVVSALSAIMPVVTAIVDVIAGLLLPIIEGISTALSGLIQFITGVFTGDWQAAWDGIVKIFEGIWGGISDFVKGVINGFIDLINGMIGGVNNITGKIGIPAIPSIPKLADGGIVRATAGGTTAIVGEGKYDEAVLPLGGPQFARLADSIASRVARGGVAASPVEPSGPLVQMDITAPDGPSAEAIGVAAADRLNGILRR